MPNIQLPDDFPTRLRTLRIERGLAESELATRSGLTYKTIRDLELGKRQRVMERTILVLTEALGLTVDDLLNGGVVLTEEPPRPRHHLRAALLGVALTMGIVGIVALGGIWYARSHAVWETGLDVLTVSDPIFGFTLWEVETDAQFRFCGESPWDASRMLVGLGSKSPEGGRVFCLERATGDTAWSVGPDVAAVTRAFGPEIVGAANFNAANCQTGDIDGDGVPDLVVRFVHGLYYPCVLAWIDRDGNLVAQYANKGHLYGFMVFDCDGDGRDEVVAWGTNNAKAYQGGTVFMLDADHWRGASLDADCGSASTEPDSALMRLVVPQFPQPYMKLLGTQRLEITSLQAYHGPNGAIMYGASISNGKGHTIALALDEQLRPRGAQPTDSFLSYMQKEWPDSLVDGTGPADEVWLAKWLTGHRRFAAGHWPPDSP